MPKIAIIVVYFGSWPQWFSAWLRSCSTNADFRWIIFTDLPAPDDTPANVHISALTPAELEARVSAMLETPFTLSRGYKLVDLKPAYGELFQDYLQNCDFWGYTDLDVIYGDLSRFFPSEILRSHDVLAPSDRLLVGHLTLLRNTLDVCQLYRRCPNYKQILCRDTHEGFDEKGFHQLVMALAKQEKLRVYLRNMKAEDIILRLSGRPQFLIIWYKGRLYDVAGFRQICHFHFMESKWNQKFTCENARETDSFLFLTPSAIKTRISAKSCIAIFLQAAISLANAVPCGLRTVLRRIRNYLR